MWKLELSNRNQWKMPWPHKDNAHLRTGSVINWCLLQMCLLWAFPFWRNRYQRMDGCCNQPFWLASWLLWEEAFQTRFWKMQIKLKIQRTVMLAPNLTGYLLKWGWVPYCGHAGNHTEKGEYNAGQLGDTCVNPKNLITCVCRRLKGHPWLAWKIKKP